MTNEDLRINIEDLVERVGMEYGYEVALWPFKKAGATCFDDLKPSHYSEVFSELMLMDADY